MRLHDDTKAYLFTLLAFVVGALLALLALAPIAFAVDALPSQPGNCEVGEGEFKLNIKEDEWEPSDPGVEVTLTLSEEGEPVFAQVPDGWVITCAKVPQPEKGAGISHLVIKEVTTSPPTTDPTTTTTSTPETSTTSVTPTTEPSTTTSTTEIVTQTTEESTTTSTQPAASPTTPETSSTTTVTKKSPSTPTSETEELPFTGPAGLAGLVLAGSALIGAGITILRKDME